MVECGSWTIVKAEVVGDDAAGVALSVQGCGSPSPEIAMFRFSARDPMNFHRITCISFKDRMSQ